MIGDQQVTHTIPASLVQQLNALGLQTPHLLAIVTAWGPVATQVLQALMDRLPRH